MCEIEKPFIFTENSIINSSKLQEIVTVVHVKFVRASAMQKLDGMNMITQLKAQNNCLIISTNQIMRSCLSV